MNELKEHRTFRNQLIFVTLILFISGIGFKVPVLIGFGCIYGLISLYNVFTYKQNKKDWENLNG